MPIGFPASPTDGQQYPTVSPVWEFDATLGVWQPIPSAAGSTPVTARLTSIVGTDDFIGFRTISGTVTPHLVSATVMDAFMGGSGSPTAPAAFTSGDWTATAIAGGIEFNLTALPSDGGSAITALQYSLNAGTSWTNFTGTGTGIRNITGLPETAQDCMVRAVNAIGNGPDSDTKTRTPLAGGTTYIEFATLSNMTAGGAAGATRTYTGSAANGTAGGPDWTLALGAAGGFATDLTLGGSTPIAGLYTAASGAWDANIQLIAYPSGGNWVVNNAAFADLVTTPRSYTAGDSVRVRYSDTGNTFLVEIALAAAPTTWLELATGTLARSGTLYPRLASFDAAGAVFTAPRVA